MVSDILARLRKMLEKREADPRTLDGNDMAQYAMKKGCPVCKAFPMKLVMGPGSGNGENAWCEDCGSRFTMYPLPSHPMMSLVCEREEWFLKERDKRERSNG